MAGGGMLSCKLDGTNGPSSHAMARHMDATARTLKPRSIGTTILDRLAEIDAHGLSPATARELLGVDFEPAARARVKILMKGARNGRLNGDEQDELDEYLHVADALAILHSKARQVLRRTSKKK